ncbi:MAG: HlyD family efflux transporter periplasmic adaptor subunit [Verrucomicrobia bacterium]|nr:HlyD family efflux transporter periplasmic adaptor subunit [Verrucomicrobiota bacterium]
MPIPNKILTFIEQQPRWRIAAAVLILVLAVVWISSSGKSASKGATFTARRGPLDISVLEGGSIQALESQEIKCEVRVGYQGTKILKIVEEGYQVTEEDVKNGKVLVELDSSDLQKQIVQQEIQYQSAVASLTDAQQGYDIQLNQNISDIKAAEQKARFARLDFDKFLGATVAQDVVEQLGLETELAAERTKSFESVGEPPKSSASPVQTNNALLVARGVASDTLPVIQLAGSTEKKPAPLAAALLLPTDPTTKPARPQITPNVEPTAPANAPPKPIVFDFSKYATIDALGDGEAKQKLRKFEDDLQVAQKELGQAKSTLEGTKRLFDKGFVTKTDLARDEIAYENARLKVQTAETARDLFLKYDFTKSAEESLSKHAEAMRELDRAKKAAVSKLAQAEARLKSAQGQYNVQLRQRNDLNEQVEKCILKAKKTGLVVYGAGGEEMYYYGNQEPIREGATVRERQAIITIPDMTRMSVKVKIHESYIKKIKKGEKVRITVDAFPDTIMEGEVTKVGVLPDSQNRWMNPDMKVYLTTITINGTYDWIKPGMSAKTEILVDHLDDVVYVPIQAVVPSEGKQICYVVRGFKPERREVEIGQFNDEFIEIKKGLKEGERVSLRVPEGTEPDTGEKEKKPGSDNNGKPKPIEKAAPPAKVG